METMNELFLDFLQDIYYAEKQGLRGMARMIKAVSDPTLKDAITQHRAQSEQQISHLDQVFEHVGRKPRGKKCAAMDGLLTEAQEQASEAEKGPILDSALLATSQAIEHYEIARYGALHAWAKAMGMDESAGLIGEVLEQEKASDARLNTIAESLNRAAAGTDEHNNDAGEVVAEVEEAPPPAAKPIRATRGRKSA